MVTVPINPGQEMTWTVGAPCLLLAALGMAGSWRRGRRLVPATIVPWLAVSLLATGAWAYRERYMLPVFPLIVASAFEGVCCLVNWLRRHGLASKRANVARVTITVMAVAFIAINAPRTLNWAFIYTWSAHTGEYYKRIAHGKYAELLPAARAASESTPAGDCVGAMGLHTSVAHLLTDRVVVQTGKNLTQEHMTAEQAAGLLDTGRVASMIVQLEETPNDFAAAFDAIARKRIQSGRWSKLFDGADYQVYGPAGP